MLFLHDILMCRPTHYDVQYEINPWMNLQERPDWSLAHQQWLQLHHTVIRCGGFVRYIDPVENLPDMVFTANAGLVYEDKIILSKFRNGERRGEEVFFEMFFKSLNRKLYILKNHFEGAGDAFIVDGTLFIGDGPRTNRAAAYEVMDILNLKKLVLCELIDPRFYHLDTCFCPLGEGILMYYPGAFSPETRKVINQERFCRIEVSEADAAKFACNSIALGNNVIIPSHCEDTVAKLSRHGRKAVSVDMDQFIKAGGAAKCLTLRL